jgi:hypothetical protein
MTIVSRFAAFLTLLKLVAEGKSSVTWDKFYARELISVESMSPPYVVCPVNPTNNVAGDVKKSRAWNAVAKVVGLSLQLLVQKYGPSVVILTDNDLTASWPDDLFQNDGNVPNIRNEVFQIECDLRLIKQAVLQGKGDDIIGGKLEKFATSCVLKQAQHNLFTKAHIDDLRDEAAHIRKCLTDKRLDPFKPSVASQCPDACKNIDLHTVRYLTGDSENDMIRKNFVRSYISARVQFILGVRAFKLGMITSGLYRFYQAITRKVRIGITPPQDERFFTALYNWFGAIFNGYNVNKMETNTTVLRAAMLMMHLVRSFEPLDPSFLKLVKNLHSVKDAFSQVVRLLFIFFDPLLAFFALL